VIASLAHRLWTGVDVPTRVARAALYPIEFVYSAAISTRQTLYDRGLLRSHQLALPAVSVGNLTVGGTGKTPVSAWFVSELARRGARPAVVLRDYGRDEALVHAALNPGVPIVTGADRVEAARRARERGADVAVLDDAFQHRRARRDADVVLLSADAWPASRRLLPAGPWREPLTALRRASLVLVTRKAATIDVLDEVWTVADARAPGVPRAAAHLAPAALIDAHSATSRPLSSLAGADVLAVAGVAGPAAFRQQLEELGARVQLHAYPDHYAFTTRDALLLAQTAERAQIVVCTLKDAVKLAPVWPRGGSGLWYLSQQVILERGRPEMERLIGGILEARSRHSQTVG
jgi:tetraacyldisaccharide 4'-kinase